MLRWLERNEAEPAPNVVRIRSLNFSAPNDLLAFTYSPYEVQE